MNKKQFSAAAYKVGFESNFQGRTNTFFLRPISEKTNPEFYKDYSLTWKILIQR